MNWAYYFTLGVCLLNVYDMKSALVCKSVKSDVQRRAVTIYPKRFFFNPVISLPCEDVSFDVLPFMSTCIQIHLT